MSMAAHPTPIFTPEQYLELEEASETRNEYYQGQIYAMAGGSFRHAVIIGNVARHMGNALEKSPCTVMSSEVRVRVAEAGLYTYPDVIVVCGEPIFAKKTAKQNTDTLLNPTLVIEVLSPSTEAHDRGFKAAQYRSLESIQEYALVSQTEARVEVFSRQGNGWLLTEAAGLDAQCRFSSVDTTLALQDIYAKVTLNGGIVDALEKTGI